MRKKKPEAVAVILAGGAGKRLESFETIKPLVKVGGKPLILWNIEALQEAGINNIHIVVAPGDTLVQRALMGDSRISAKLEYIEQDESQTSMLGSILALADRIKGPLFVTVCDVIFEKNPYSIFLKTQRQDEAIYSLVSADKKAGRNSGATVRVLTQKRRIVRTGTRLLEFTAMESGVYYFGQTAFRKFQACARSSKLTHSFEEALSLFAQQAPVIPIDYGKARWFDVNTPSILIRAELFLRSRKEPHAKGTGRLERMSAPITYRYQKELTFDVFVKRGLLRHLDKYEIIPNESYYSLHYLLVDKNIDRLYGNSVLRQLRSLGYHVNKIAIDPGEWSKSAEVYLNLASQILGAGIDKKSVILSLGGGVVKDIAGFLASTLYRGIGSIHFPTTVLAQCDAAIALKQGVNGEGGKNLIGSYYAPLKVIVDPDVLKTLEDRYVSDGLSECLKQAFAQDVSFFKMFKDYAGPLKHIPFLEKVIRKSIKLKIGAIQKDFYEDNCALVYQYGHEVGHAVEFLSGYKLAHGESVAIGMRVSAELANLLGIADQATRTAQCELLRKYKLPINVPRDIRPDDIINMLRCNKKFHGGEARFVLVKAIGAMWHDRRHFFVSCSDELIRQAIQRSYEYVG
ncbi:MAG: NTP transferase domain-containing protein [Patescibacteria group bacterium]